MDKLTALRTFGNSSLTPAKRVKVFNERWYEVVMQNTERDQGDGYYLAEGTYTELLPGKEARGRREARLNHCNGIAEYTGPVFEFLANEYGGQIRHVGYFRNAEEVQKAADKAKAAHNKWVSDCIDSALKHESDAEKIASGEKKVNIAFTPEWHLDTAREILERTAERCNKFRCDFKVIR